MRDGLIGLANTQVPSDESVPDADSKEESCCYICLDEPKDPYRVPTCRHIFCFNCLRKWQGHAKIDPEMNSNQNSCPACRGADTPNLEKSATENALLYATRATNGKDLVEKERESYRQKALAELDRVSDSGSVTTRFQTLGTRGEILRDLGRYAEAIESFEEIIRLREEGVNAKEECETLMREMNQASSEGREDDADAIADQIDPLLGKVAYAALNPTEVINSHLTIAEIKEELMDFDGALDVYKYNVMAIFEYDTNDLPRNFTAVQQRRLYMGMSRCFYYKKDYKKAIGLGESAIEMNRHFPQIHKYVALAQKASGDMEAAVRTMARAVHYETPWDDANRKKVLEMYESVKREMKDIYSATKLH